MAWYTHPVVRYVLATLSDFRRGLTSPALGGQPVVRARAAYAFHGPLGYFEPCCVLIVVALVIAARGGLQGEPLRWGRAFHGKSEFANQMSLNSLYSLAVAGRDSDASRARYTGDWKGEAYRRPPCRRPRHCS